MRHYKKIKFICFFLLLLTSCSYLKTEAPKKTPVKEKVEILFSGYDTNNNGSIDKKEFKEIQMPKNENNFPTTAMFQIFGLVLVFCFLPKILSALKNVFWKNR